MIPGLGPRVFLRLAPVFLVLAAAAGAARADPPARVARLSESEGTVSFAPAGETEWTELQRNRPLTRGDRLWADRGTRAELQVGSSAVRLNGQARLDILALDDQSTQLSVTQGSVYVHVRRLSEGENFEIDTPNLAYRAAYPGDYRIDVDPEQSTTRVTIHSGTGAVFGENGQTLQLGGGQQITFRARALTQVASQESPPDDAFDAWAGERNRREEQSIAARYVPREVVGYQQLDPAGQWRRHETYGAIWFPQGMPAKWAPYRDGHWEWVRPWGWNWIDNAPWGFAPFHYGRWALVEDRWAWVPGRLSVQPVYAPALVAFVGGSQSELTWFPLAPNEAWQPSYPASALYISNVNRNIPLAPVTSYAYQRRAEALSVLAVADFDRGRPSGSGWWRVATSMLTNPPIVPSPSVPSPAVLEHKVSAARDPKAVSGTPAASAPRPVLAQPAAPAPAAALASRTAAQPRPGIAAPPAMGTAPVAQHQTQPAGAPRARGATAPAAATASIAKERPAAPQAQRHHAGRGTASPRTRELARGTEQARATRAAHAGAGSRQHEQHTAQKRVPHAQPVARREPARQQLARRAAAEHAERQAQARLRLAKARRAEQARLQARARADEQLRREMHASQVEQARRVAGRDAQALRQQRLRREEQPRQVVQEHDAAPGQQEPASPWPQRAPRRARPDLSQPMPARQPDIWQRGWPPLAPGPTS